MRGTPYYDMALDGGYRGDEAEEMARQLEWEHQRQEEEHRREEEERRWQEEHRCPACGDEPEVLCAACGASPASPSLPLPTPESDRDREEQG